MMTACVVTDNDQDLHSWLHEKQLSSLESILVDASINLNILSCLDQAELTQLIKELKLPILEKYKFQTAVAELQSKHPNNTNNNNNNHPDETKLDDGISVYSGTSTMSDITRVTGISSIAPALTVDDPLIVILGIGTYNGLLDLDGINITKDYVNIKTTFGLKWKYKIFYQLSDNSNVYSKDAKELKEKDNYKLHWTIDEIAVFIETARHYVVTNKHNGLIFAISGHGDTGKVIYDSDCEECQLDNVFSMFAPEFGQLLESYKETQEESNRLFQIPKIFIVDTCRGDWRAKVTNIANVDNTKNNTNSTSSTNSANSDKDKENDDIKNNKIDVEEKRYDANNKDRENNSKETKPSATLSLHEKNNHNHDRHDNSATKHEVLALKNKDPNASKQHFLSKSVNKQDAQKLAAQMVDFCKLYANVEGYTVGGLLLRSVCKVFDDTEFVLHHSWTEMIFKIREYTKREATVIGAINFTQLVENEGTLEKQVRFYSKYLSNHSNNNSGDSTDNEEKKDDSTLSIDSVAHNAIRLDRSTIDDVYDDEEEDEEDDTRVVITNLSQKYNIAVLVENEQNLDNRNEMYKMLMGNTSKSGNGKDKKNPYAAFKKNGFVIIQANTGTHTFTKLWDYVFITLFVLGHSRTSFSIFSGIQNKKIYDRRKILDNYLYFNSDTMQLLPLMDANPKCNGGIGISKGISSALTKNLHELKQFFATEIDPGARKKRSNGSQHNIRGAQTPRAASGMSNRCVLCLRLKSGSFYYCDECKHSICERCCTFMHGKHSPITLAQVTKAPLTIKGIIEVHHRLIGSCVHQFTMSVKCGVSQSWFKQVKNISKFTGAVFKFEIIVCLKQELNKKESMIHLGVIKRETLSMQDLNVKEYHMVRCSFNFEQNNYNIDIIPVIISQIRLVDCKYNFYSKLSSIYHSSAYQYQCTFTTLNGKGRFGPTSIVGYYTNQYNFNDTSLNHNSIQLWKVPKTGKWIVICYGAKGGDSINDHEHLCGGKGAVVGGVIKLFKDDIIGILCGHAGQNDNSGKFGGGGGGGTFFVLHKAGNHNVNYRNRNRNRNKNGNYFNDDGDNDDNDDYVVVDIPLIIASGGNGACNANHYSVNGIDGLCNSSGNRNNFGGYESHGRGGRGGSFNNDFKRFKSFSENSSSNSPTFDSKLSASDDSINVDFNGCNPESFVNGAIGGQGYTSDGCEGGFGGGGGSGAEGGAGGGYIGGLVSNKDVKNSDVKKYAMYGALSYNSCQNDNMKINISGKNDSNGKVTVSFYAISSE